MEDPNIVTILLVVVEALTGVILATCGFLIKRLFQQIDLLDKRLRSQHEKDMEFRTQLLQRMTRLETKNESGS